MMTKIKKLSKNTKMRFLLVGFWNTLFGYSCFVVFDLLLEDTFSLRFFGYASASILTKIIANTQSYLSHKYLTFQTKGKKKVSLKEYLKFWSSSLTAQLIGFSFIVFLVEWMHFEPRMAVGMVLILNVSTRYFLHKNFTFRNSF